MIQDFINETCDKLEKHDQNIQAFLPEPGRRKRLLKEAAELERRYNGAEKRLPLYGVLVGIKDIFRVDGLPTRAGSKLPAGLFEGPDAECVERLRRAGALILGKTVTTEFAYFEPGSTRNPHNLNHTPGGSSSGSAAAVAAEFCSIAVGTQTIGSIIRPAAYCGVVGFKPSYGRISREGVIAFSSSMDHVGIFTNDIDMMKKAAMVLCKTWNVGEIEMQLETGDEEPPILGVPEGAYLKQAPKMTLDYFEQQLDKFQSAGYIIKRVQAMPDIAKINLHHRRLIAAEFADVHRFWFAKNESLYRKRTAELIKLGQEVDEKELAELRKSPYQLRQELKESMELNKIDLWVSPSALGEAPEGIENTGDPIMNLAWTHAGLPALNLPAGSGEKGLPLGMQFCAGYMRDEALLGWAEDLETVLKKG